MAVSELIADRPEGGVCHVRAGLGERGSQDVEKIAALGLQLGFPDAAGLQAAPGLQQLEPFGFDLALVFPHEFGERGRLFCCH